MVIDNTKLFDYLTDLENVLKSYDSLYLVSDNQISPIIAVLNKNFESVFDNIFALYKQSNNNGGSHGSETL